MKFTHLTTLLFFLFISITSACADSSSMEKEIIRDLEQIEKMGVRKWQGAIKSQEERLKQDDKENTKRQEPTKNIVSLN